LIINLFIENVNPSESTSYLWLIISLADELPPHHKGLADNGGVTPTMVLNNWVISFGKKLGLTSEAFSTIEEEAFCLDSVTNLKNKTIEIYMQRSQTTTTSRNPR